MIWTKPGHQLDEEGEKIVKIKNIYLFGTDEEAKNAYDFMVWLGLDKDFRISFIWDESEHEDEQVPSVFCGKQVISYNSNSSAEDIVGNDRDNSIVVLKSYGHTRRRDLLINKGIDNIYYMISRHNEHRNFIQNFICIYLMYKHNKLLSHWTNYLVTSKCNLNCKGCLNFSNYMEKSSDSPFEEFKKHFEILFSKFDYLYSLHFSGGEPLLTKNLSERIRYINNNYRDRIYDFYIITNGTIIPSDEVLDALKQADAWVFIDDYSDSVAITKIQEITMKLDEKGIKYKISKAPYWYDLAIEETDYSNCSGDEIERHKDDCHSYLHEFADGNIYACCYQQYASRVGKDSTEEDNDLIHIAECSKMEILEFRQGYTKKGYTSLCRKCRGIGPCALKTEVAVQIPRQKR